MRKHLCHWLPIQYSLRSEYGFLGWPETKHETGLDESWLKVLVDMTAGSPYPAQDGEVAVSEAEQMLAQFFTVEAALPEHLCWRKPM